MFVNRFEQFICLVDFLVENYRLRLNVGINKETTKINSRFNQLKFIASYDKNTPPEIVMTIACHFNEFNWLVGRVFRYLLNLPPRYFLHEQAIVCCSTKEGCFTCYCTGCHKCLCDGKCFENKCKWLRKLDNGLEYCHILNPMMSISPSVDYDYLRAKVEKWKELIRHCIRKNC